MSDETAASNGQTRLAYILGVPLADDVVREWPQMGEIVRGRELIGAVIVTFRGGKVARWEDWTNRAEALETAGLLE